MRSSWLARLVLTGCLWAGVAHAYGKEPKPFQPPREMTAEEIEAEKERSKVGSNITRYGQDVAIKAEPFPWLAAGLFALVFIVVTPFAIRAYKNTSRELTGEDHEDRGERRRSRPEQS